MYVICSACINHVIKVTASQLNICLDKETHFLADSVYITIFKPGPRLLRAYCH